MTGRSLLLHTKTETKRTSGEPTNFTCGNYQRENDKRGGCEGERCLSCVASLETNDYLFQCSKRPQFKRRILALIDNMKTKIDSGLYFVLYHGIADYMEGNNNHADKVSDKAGNSTIPKSIPLANPTAQNGERKQDHTNTDLSSFLLLQNKQ